MLSYIWPIALVVLSNVVYQLCTKSAPEDLNPLASLTVTYLVGAAVSAVMFYALGGKSLVQEYYRLNWVPFVLGISLVGLEAGFIYAFRAGWEMSTAHLVMSALLEFALIAMGVLLFQEALTWNKLVGVAVCLAGLALINMK